MFRFAVLLAVAASPLAAQMTTEVAPPQYAGPQTHVPGVFVTPIANIPLTAVVDISTMRTLPDGTTELRRTANHIARSSSGKIYNERRMLVPAAFQKQPPLLGIHTYDPQTRVSQNWTPFTDVVHTVTLSARQVTERKPFLVSVPGTTDQDLGTSTMSGVSVRGLRRTRELSMQGTGPAAKPIHITDEYWYSEDLHLIMLEKHDDPRTGEQIVSIIDVKTAEPPAQLFTPPSNYHVVDETSTVQVRSNIDPFASPPQTNAPTQTVNVR
ncbi:hypothetical protein [Terriglobus aquaticus]|uniref:Uncharacterized protein n=1 Tax=Terriglobus aquaticus TaxID=940139 RepID=A0ABW9KHB8_9BACT|nr:hypothetical protein [Terriglobus aquaticus]